MNEFNLCGIVFNYVHNILIWNHFCKYNINTVKFTNFCVVGFKYEWSSEKGKKRVSTIKYWPDEFKLLYYIIIILHYYKDRPNYPNETSEINKKIKSKIAWNWFRSLNWIGTRTF